MSERASQRLFIAIDPPAAVCAEVCAWAREQRVPGGGLRVMQPQNVHLTLAFLGERRADEISAIADAMALAAQSVPGQIPDLATADPLLLPRRRPRVLALAVKDPERRLAVLQSTLAGELAEAIGWGDARAFHPHLTAARFARDAETPDVLTPAPRLPFEAAELVLHRSFLEPAGARYEVIERVALN